jgi:tRNA dimethylallyltransferase
VRVIRALELFEITGQKKSEMSKSESPFDCLILMPKIEHREVLYKKIDERSKQIWHSGLLDEAKVLVDQKLDEMLPALKTIGIPEAFALFRGETSEEKAISTMQQKSRNYAKRQMTWWRGDERVFIIDTSSGTLHQTTLLSSELF